MSKRDTERAFVRMSEAAAECGLDVAGWSLEPGQPSLGIAWKVYTPSGSTGLVGMPSFGHIGRTAKEAEHFLSGMAAALETVNYAAMGILDALGED